MAKFVKGISGNPSGRPKDVFGLRQLAQEKTEAALDTLAEIMADKNAPPGARVSAAVALLDRGFGKPSQSVAVSGDPLTTNLAVFMAEKIAQRDRDLALEREHAHDSGQFLSL